MNMRSKLFFQTLLFIFILTGWALAHPLGNFSINQYSKIEVEKSEVKLRSVLDMAEIPTFQQSQNIDTDKDGKLSEKELNAYTEKISPEYLSNLLLTVNGQKIELRPTSKNIDVKKGSGNLSTMKIVWDLVGDLPSADGNYVYNFNFENKNYPERIGWNEIVVGRVSGVSVFNSTAFGSSITNELEAYPQQSLDAPLSERTAEFSATTGTVPPNAAALENRDGHETAPVQKDGFAELINVPEITPTIIIFGLLLAFGFGAMHAMSPGHGKAVVGAYLVGSRGTPKHAIFLGLTVTVTHTLGVFALGFITLFASNYILPEKIMPFLNFFSGLLVLFIGLTLFKNRLFMALGYQKEEHHHHAFDHAHTLGNEEQNNGEYGDHHYDGEEHDYSKADDGMTHTHGGSTHTHLPPENVTWRSLLGLGISGGLLPCPSALVLMLSAISADRIGYGLVLTLVFSFGLAATLTGVGLAFLYAGKFFESRSLGENKIIKALPIFSSFVIACIGAVICYNSLM